MTSKLWIAVGIALGLLSTRGVNGEILFEAESRETVRVRRDAETGRVVTEQQKVNYYPITLYRKEGTTSLVARETLQTSQDEGMEGIRSKLKAEFFVAGADGNYPKNPGVVVEIPDVHEARFLDDGWEALTYGCCDAETYGRLYAYDGKTPFLRFNERYWKVSVPNAPDKTRFVGMTLRAHVPNEAATEALFGGHPEAVVCVSYAAPGKTLDRVYLKPAKSAEADTLGLHTEKLELTSLSGRDEVHAGNGSDRPPDIEMWSMDGAAAENRGRKGVSGLVIAASVYLGDGSTESLRLEVENDRLVRPEMTGSRLKVDAGND